MSLLMDAMEEFTMQDKLTEPDGYGGYTIRYVDGADIMAACVLLSSNEIIAAQQAGTNARYKITTHRGINLQFHDVLRRARDGKIFRVTSDGDDNLTPKSAGLDMRQVDAEEWELPK